MNEREREKKKESVAQYLCIRECVCVERERERESECVNIIHRIFGIFLFGSSVCYYHGFPFSFLFTTHFTATSRW